MSTTASRATIWILVTSAFAALNFYALSNRSDRDQDVVYEYDLLAGAVFAYGLLFVFVLAITSGLPRREALGLRPPESWWKAVALSLGSVVVIFVGAAIVLSVLGAGDEQNLAPEDWDGSRAGAYAASFLAIVFIGPTVEELLYRGAGMSLLAPYGSWVAVAGTAVLFGLGHGLLLSLGAFIWFGLVIGVLRLRTGSLYPAIFAHSLFNAVGMIGPLVV